MFKRTIYIFRLMLVLCFNPAHQYVTLRVIHNLTISSHGYDDVLPKMKYVVMALSYIIYCSLVTSIVPHEFKIAKLLLIFINSKHDDPCSYHPVSILPNFSRIFEKFFASGLFL